MAQPEAGHEGAESDELNGNAQAVQRTIGDQIGHCSAELAQALVDSTISKGNLDLKLGVLEAEAESFHEDAESGDLDPAEYVERAETLSETIEGLRAEAEKYEQSMSRVNDAFETQDHAIQPGTFVTDEQERDSSKRLIVLGWSDDDASKYTFGPERTPVAEANPEYPADDPVVEMIYEKTALDEFGTRGTPDNMVEQYDDGGLEERGIRLYAFPASRVEVADDQDSHLL